MFKCYHLLTIIICVGYWDVVSLICDTDINSTNQLNYTVMTTLKEIRIFRLMEKLESRIEYLTILVKSAANDYYIGNINHRQALMVYKSNIKALMYYSRVYQSLEYDLNLCDTKSKEMFIEVTTLIKFFEC